MIAYALLIHQLIVCITGCQCHVPCISAVTGWSSAAKIKYLRLNAGKLWFDRRRGRRGCIRITARSQIEQQQHRKKIVTMPHTIPCEKRNMPLRAETFFPHNFIQQTSELLSH